MPATELQPTHPKARWATGIIHGVHNFAELEDRIAALPLLRQTLHEWARYTNWGDQFRFLCVCSDPSVSRDTDELMMQPEDSDFSVSTDKSEVERLWASNDNAQELLGWSPSFGGLEGFRRGLCETVSWFTAPANEAFYKANIYNL